MSDTNHFFEERKMRLLIRHRKTAPSMHQLETLRAYLHHFDQSPDFGDGEAVAAIRKHLMIRIREAEGAIQYPERRLQDCPEITWRSGGQFPLRAEAA